MMVTPYTARSWGIFEAIQGEFRDVNNPFEFIKAKLPALRYWENSTNLAQPQNKSGHYPHAGILASSQFLLRYPNTDSNRNRHRTRVYFQIFLGVDLMELAPAVADSAAVAAQFENPVTDSPDCTVCHQVMDPVAGLFRDYDNSGAVEVIEFEEDYKMFSPGYDINIPFPEDERWRALQWLAEKTVKDNRFPPTMVEHAYYMLMQEKVSRPPSNTEDPLFKYRRNGYDAQREIINTATKAFVADNLNYKSALKSLIRSKFYRASGRGGSD